ncbi:MAG: hypothetical protein NDI60_07865 [Elusimicrobiales bacterium]|nr:hypothetical protein [Elusimicrobiales bacterium]
MRRLWLALTDPRVKATLGALDRSGPALGDLCDHPELAGEFFPPLRKTLAKAAALPGKRPAAFRALLAAEDLTIRLERLFSDMARLEARPDALPQALLLLQRACALGPRLLADGSRAKTLAEAAALCAAGHKVLAQAKAAADRDPGEFTQNLKFSSIYSGLDAVFDSFERCAEALSRI